MHCFPASTFLSQKHNKTLSKTIFLASCEVLSFRFQTDWSGEKRWLQINLSTCELGAPSVWLQPAGGADWVRVPQASMVPQTCPAWTDHELDSQHTWGPAAPRVRGMCLGSPGTWTLGGLIFWLSTYRLWSILTVLCKCFPLLILTFIKAMTGFPTFYFLTVFLAICSTYYLFRKFL